MNGKVRIFVILDGELLAEGGPDGMLRQQVPIPVIANDMVNVRIVDHIRESISGKFRVEWYECAAGFQNANHC